MIWLTSFRKKTQTLSFRGTPRAEESLFFCVSSTERFLTSFGMTTKGNYSATCKTTPHKDSKKSRTLQIPNSRTPGYVPQPARRCKKTEEQKTVVSEMHEITGGNGSGSRAYPSQKNADPNQQADLPPAAPKLLRVHRSEQDAGHDHTRADAEAARDNRIQEAAEDRFFHQWRHQNTEAHQQDHGRPRAEQLFDGKFAFFV